MLTLELSSYQLEIPHDAYMLLSQTMIGCSLLQSQWLCFTCSRVLQAYWMVLDNNEKAILHINKGYWPIINSLLQGSMLNYFLGFALSFLRLLCHKRV